MISIPQNLSVPIMPVIENPQINTPIDMNSINLDMLDDQDFVNRLMKQVLGHDFVRDPEEWIPPTSYPKKRISGDEPDATTSMEQLANENGFDCESYEVTTEDNYVLKMFRINKKGVQPTKPPVMFQHGLFSDSSTWIVNEELSPGFQLATLGYDVWFGNNRGNIYSRHNTKINPNDDSKDFFSYSFYQLG